MLNWIAWNRTVYLKMDLALNNLQRLICHKHKQTNKQLFEWELVKLFDYKNISIFLKTSSVSCRYILNVSFLLFLI